MLAFAALAASACSETPAPPGSHGRTGEPSPQRARAAAARAEDREAPRRIGEGAGDAAPAALWSVALEHPASAIHVTPTGEVVAAGPDRITVVDRSGQHRWHRNVAPGDLLLPSGRCLFVRLARGSIVSAFNELGRPAWERIVEGTLEPLGDGSLLAIDAASVRSLECADGNERWMFSPDRIRSLRFMSVGADALVLLGELGQRRLLYQVGLDGRVRSSTELPHESDSALVVSSDRLLARTADSIVVLDGAGRRLWSTPVTTRTVVGVHRGAVILGEGNTDGEVVTRVLGPGGQVEATCSAQLGSEPVALRILGSDQFPLMLAACAGALSSCAERRLWAGPFNRLWTCSTADGTASELVGPDSGLYFDIGQWGDEMVVMTTSDQAQPTEVIRLDPTMHQTRLASFAERRMTGPVSARDGTWLVATCVGDRCGEPWTLLAVGGRERE